MSRASASAKGIAARLLQSEGSQKSPSSFLSPSEGDRSARTAYLAASAAWSGPRESTSSTRRRSRASYGTVSQK